MTNLWKRKIVAGAVPVALALGGLTTIVYASHHASAAAKTTVKVPAKAAEVADPGKAASPSGHSQQGANQLGNQLGETQQGNNDQQGANQQGENQQAENQKGDDQQGANQLGDTAQSDKQQGVNQQGDN